MLKGHGMFYEILIIVPTNDQMGQSVTVEMRY